MQNNSHDVCKYIARHCATVQYNFDIGFSVILCSQLFVFLCSCKQLEGLRYFSLTEPFRPQHGPGVESASNRNEYQKSFLGVKTAGAYG
jgi:hypothetical protein